MTDQNTHYTPIDCGLHSEYELAIMHKTKSILHWLDSSDTRQVATVIPLDIFTRYKQEYLKVITEENSEMEIRLDKIVSLQAV